MSRPPRGARAPVWWPSPGTSTGNPSRYETPLTLPAGSQVAITCGYDTSKETKTITSASTEDEMRINFLDVTR